MDDQRLLREYVASHSDEAFTELVRLHLGLVYSAALRRLGDRAAAEDVTQGVFTLLAQKARDLGPPVILAGWLYQTACFKAAHHQRAERRRAQREQEAAAMQDPHASPEPAAAWERIEPLLDDAMQEMSETDRAAILLRFFQQKRLREVGIALGLEEDAARKRVDRALEKLRDWFAARGVAYPAASIAAVLSAQAASAAPAMLAAAVSATALKAAAGATAATFLPILAIMKLKPVLITASVLVLGAAVAIYKLGPPAEPPPAPALPRNPIAATSPDPKESPVARVFTALQQGQQTAGSADEELNRALARLKEALYGPPSPADQKTDPARDILSAIPVEKRAAALDLVLGALRDENKHVCLRAIHLVPLIWPQGEAALPTLFDLIRSKSGEWSEVASAAMIAAAQARPQPDIVPELVAAAMQGPANAHRALAAQIPLLKSFVPGSEAAFVSSLRPYLYSVDPEWRSVAARVLAQVPGPKDPAVLSELTARLTPLRDGTPPALGYFGPSLEALWKMGPDAAAAVPALVEFGKKNPEWTDHVNLVLKAVAPEDLKGVGSYTPLPPLDTKAEAMARQIEQGTLGIAELGAALENPKTALVAARALAEFGPAAKEALPSLRRAFDAAVETDLSTALVLGAAIERLDPAAPKPLLSSLEIVPALQAVQAEAKRASVPAWNSALQTLPERVPLRSAFTHEDMRLLAADLGGISPRLRDAFIASLLASDEKFAAIFEPAR